MRITASILPEVLILEPLVHGDNRGWFTESYSKRTLAEHGINIEFVQDNRSFSAQKGTLRGLHFQSNPKAQAKLIHCLRGAILDVAVDLRRGSPRFAEYIAVELSAENKKQLLIPKGFAHAFLTLTDDVEVLYKVDEYYSPECDRGICYDDPDINIDWNFAGEPILSDKDRKAPTLANCDNNFIYRGDKS